ncbi:riboflavin synthase subunit alpha [PVC group bacterium (ex Bugula neritina AB1)]|nr:riboflavin synthase subunit alpha [PVC group bacterium (ex Bugula neritina AB1)]
MFTGLIEDLGKVITIEDKHIDGMLSKRLVIEPYDSDISDLSLGSSLAVNGVCLTVVGAKKGRVSFDIVQTTLSVTNLGCLKKGDKVNLERTVPLGSRLEGHICTGHVDYVGEVIALEKSEKCFLLTVSFDRKWGKYVVPKGSVALDGISLTILECSSKDLIVSIVPHTLQKTNLKNKKWKDKINIEFDYLGKYVISYLSQRDEEQKINPVDPRD